MADLTPAEVHAVDTVFLAETDVVAASMASQGNQFGMSGNLTKSKWRLEATAFAP
jgi:hypothetical protein